MNIDTPLKEALKNLKDLALPTQAVKQRAYEGKRVNPDWNESTVSEKFLNFMFGEESPNERKARDAIFETIESHPLEAISLEAMRRLKISFEKREVLLPGLEVGELTNQCQEISWSMRQMLAEIFLGNVTGPEAESFLLAMQKRAKEKSEDPEDPDTTEQYIADLLAEIEESLDQEDLHSN